MLRAQIQKALTVALAEAGVSTEEIALEHPADLKNGDYATGAALQYAKQAGMKPRELAEKIVATLGNIDGVAKIEIAGAGFINFYLAPLAITESIDAARKEDMWGSNASLKEKKIMVEYTDPNPFKEFHIGHLMSNAIGEAISRLLQFSGAEVKRANYQGDVGPHVAKAMYMLLERNIETPTIADISSAYAEGSRRYEEHPEDKKKIDELNVAIYRHTDENVLALYEHGKKVSLEHFERLYEILGTRFDFYFFESETGKIGADLVNSHPGVFEKSDAAIVYKGEKVGLHTRVFLTSQGLPTYEAKDLGLAKLKFERWKSDISITITAHEQVDYFKVILAAMNQIMPEIAQKIRHISHGMMRLPTGKMSSRTGDVITGESLLNELIEAAKERATESRANDKGELAEQVAVAAIKYQILKQASGKDIIFDRERALSLEGDSGPYLQYAHARTNAITEKAKEQNVDAKTNVNAEPSNLTRLLHRFPEVVERAAEGYEPHYVTNYLLEVASQFNSWYAQEQILDGTPAAAHKVAIAEAVGRTLKNGLWILSIPAPEKM